MESRPGVAYRRPDADPTRFVVETAEEPRLNVEAFPQTGWLEIVAEADRNRLREALDGETVDVTYRLTVDDEPTWVHERGSLEEHGDVVGYLFPASDRIERQRQIERERERLEEFASVVSHDLRNPLSVAVGNIELARDFDGEAADDRLDRARDALDWMDDLISDLLALAREGRSVEEMSATELRTVVDSAWRSIAAETDAELVVDEPLSVVDCDRSRLRQALENLFRNAVEHGTDGDHVVGETSEVSVVDEDDGDGHSAGNPPVRVFVGRCESGFYVADDGSGIPEKQREAVFEPGHSTAADGTGFGLAIVERIAEAHDWEVSVTESRAGGARFEFRGIDCAPSSEATADDLFGGEHVATGSGRFGGSSTE